MIYLLLQTAVELGRMSGGIGTSGDGSRSGFTGSFPVVSTGCAGGRANIAVPLAGLRAIVDRWLVEDCPGFDYGGAVVGSRMVQATLFAKSPGVLAGTVFFNTVFDALGCTVEWAKSIEDGAVLDIPTSGKVGIATVSGPAFLVLQGERVALNTLAECSGIATAAARVVRIANNARWSGRIAGTRKTTPGFRLVQKYGMMVGGMDTHRMDLSSMIMLKDNHIAAAGSIPGAISEAKQIGGFSLKVDVECSNLSDALVAADAGADVVMLDNFSPEDFREAAKNLRKAYPKLLIEGSGGLTEETVSNYFAPEADVLSFSVNRYATPLDMSLKIQPASP